ncbi:MAG: hypothetical protein JOZ25_01475 [Actinobacteria bacterium]|nr:hypothetical protein [Actinomycetota bacterium]
MTACDAAPGGVNNSWFGSASASMIASVVCPTQRQQTAGIRAAVGRSTSPLPMFSKATFAFDAPAGTTLEQVKAQFSVHRQDSYWDVGIGADGRLVFGCPAGDPYLLCIYDTSYPGITQTVPLSGAHRVYVQTQCLWLDGCETDPHQPPFGERAGIHLYSAVVRVRDDSAPRVWAVDGAIVTGGWLAGSHYIGHAASDNTGIASTALYVDNRKVDDRERDCDYTRPRPCADLPYGRYLFDTQTLTDGVHDYRVEARDAAGNVSSFSGQIEADNSAPDMPTDVVVDGGEDWRRTNSFELHWKNPASAAPIVAARYSLCSTASSACTTGVRRADGIAAIDDLSVPAPGEYALRLWLEDAAGNVNGANASIPVHLRFDDVAPGKAKPRDRTGWIGAVEARDFAQVIDLGSGETVPASGIAGYSVTTDGSDPDDTLDVVGSTFHIADLPEGATTVKARAISGSGIASPAVGETIIRADRTPPDATTSGAPAPGGWVRVPAAFDIVGSDQALLSGMSGASPDDPVEKGAFVTYRVDAGEPQRVRGALAHVAIAEDGDHVLTYRAVDAAGNESPERTLHVLVDRTAPELVVFEMPNPEDPRTVVATASDRTSGLGSGVIEVRPVTAGAADWHALATERHGDRFLATVPDDALKQGIYELRARVLDRAGNEAVGDRYRNGSQVRVDTANMRTPTRLVAGIGSAGGSGNRKAKFARRLTLGYGKRAAAHGTVTSVAGDPLAAATVLVYSRIEAAGAAYRLVGQVRTNRLGAFDYAVPAGASRALRFIYAGSPRTRAAQDEVQLGVRAAATIKSDRRRARNHEAVTFTGRLLGKPIPAAGKVLDLQAFYRGKWRTFATPRASSRTGAWRYRYRFGATTGRVVYPFRVKIRSESAYPYVAGYSKVIKVVVSG